MEDDDADAEREAKHRNVISKAMTAEQPIVYEHHLQRRGKDSASFKVRANVPSEPDSDGTKETPSTPHQIGTPQSY
ncbi:MAG TPA: hypothetical protein VE954_38420 [Oligoflexus sp.]|uniref:hypothetical protein n=1 Tax=Oligoflexus sp. TaxID=1971216 RepID=UPI002D30533D|nr:hypothetical protein [Oligoflexus sp.]HYX39016.1 hypothetical protein [Oligoflexus sp.]